MVCYNITILFRSFCVTQSSVDGVLHSPDLTQSDILLIPRRLRDNSPRAPIHTLGFSGVPVLSWVQHLFPALVCIWTYNSSLTDDGFFLPYTKIIFHKTQIQILVDLKEQYYIFRIYQEHLRLVLIKVYLINSS